MILRKQFLRYTWICCAAYILCIFSLCVLVNYEYVHMNGELHRAYWQRGHVIRQVFSPGRFFLTKSKQFMQDIDFADRRPLGQQKVPLLRIGISKLDVDNGGFDTVTSKLDNCVQLQVSNYRPLLFACLCSVSLMHLGVALRYRRTLLRQALCAQCAYPRDKKSLRCPECGETFDRVRGSTL